MAIPIIITIVILLLLFLIMRPSGQEKEQEKRLRESLEDAFIYDPETGAKITLEQAESGNWLLPDEETRKRNEDELKKYDSPGDRRGNEVAEAMKAAGYVRNILTDEEIKVLDNTNILSKYDGWSYSFPFIHPGHGTAVFYPAVEIMAKVKGEEYFKESQLMFRVKIDDYGGHYYFREKTNAERIMDVLRNDDLIRLDNYESFVIEKGSNILSTIRLMEKLDKEKGLEIEIDGGNLFIKTFRFPNINDFARIDKIINAIKP